MDESQFYGTSLMAGWGLFCAAVMFVLPIACIYQISTIKRGIVVAHHLTPGRLDEVKHILTKVRSTELSF
jgi:hypothetical protein